MDFFIVRNTLHTPLIGAIECSKGSHHEQPRERELLALDGRALCQPASKGAGAGPPPCPRKPLGNLTRLAGRYPTNREIRAEVTRGIAVCIPGDGDSGRDAVARVISKRGAGRVVRRQTAAPNLAGNIRPLPTGGPVLLAEQPIAKIAQSMCKPLVALRIHGMAPQMHLDSAVVPLAQTCQRLSERSKRLRTSRVLIGPCKTAGRAHAN